MGDIIITLSAITGGFSYEPAMSHGTLISPSSNNGSLVYARYYSSSTGSFDSNTWNFITNTSIIPALANMEINGTRYPLSCTREDTSGRATRRVYRTFGSIPAGNDRYTAAGSRVTFKLLNLQGEALDISTGRFLRVAAPSPAISKLRAVGSNTAVINNPRRIYLGEAAGYKPIHKIYLGKGAGQTPDLLFQEGLPPLITAFSAAPHNIDLDTTPSGTITFALAVTGTTGEVTHAQIVELPNGNSIGATFTGASGLNISQSLPNILQPNKPTTYRLIARNDEGSAHKDFTVNVTKNPRITNLRRIGSVSRTGFTTYTFGFTLEGLPRPSVGYVFGGGQTGTVNPSHFVQGSNPYTWTVNNWQITMPNANAQTLVLTATNSSGSSTARMANINA